MATSFRFKVHIGFILFLLLFIGSYAIGRTSDLRNGVALKVKGIENGSIVTNPILEISGSAKNATTLLVNGKNISITDTGIFADTLLLSPGYTIITVQATDKFHKETTKTYHVYVEKSPETVGFN